MKIDKLRSEYQSVQATAERFQSVIVDQITSLMQPLTLGVPIESRVKSWSSVEERLRRKPIDLQTIVSLDDLVGVRIILLFRRDLEKALGVLQSKFKVLSTEDKASALPEGQFGYQSHHCVVKLPETWLEVPSLADLGNLKAELQIRTLAQHIWAGASHKLQYKQAEGVPPPVRRAIYRVSALLETVDLEFERVLDERESYTAKIGSSAPASPLNVDLLASVLSDLFPPQNKDEIEEYSDLLNELIHYGIGTPQLVRDLLVQEMDAVLEEEARRVSEGAHDVEDEERAQRASITLTLAWHGPHSNGK